jgi:cell division protein FtsQ
VKVLKKMTILASLLIFMFLLAGAYFGIKTTDVLKIKTIEVIGVSPPTAERLKLKLNSQIGKSFWKFPIATEVSLLKEDPWIESVEIRREMPGNIAVFAREKVPVALIGNGKGIFNFVDSNSHIIQAKGSPLDLARLPALFGFDGSSKDSLREQAVKLLKNLPEDGFVSHRDVSEISFDDEHGFQMTLAKTGLVVELGKESLPVRVDRSRKVVQYLDEHQISAVKVDSDYSKKVLVKVRKGR